MSNINQNMIRALRISREYRLREGIIGSSNNFVIRMKRRKRTAALKSNKRNIMTCYKDQRKSSDNYKIEPSEYNPSFKVINKGTSKLRGYKQYHISSKKYTKFTTIRSYSKIRLNKLYNRTLSMIQSQIILALFHIIDFNYLSSSLLIYNIHIENH